MIGSNVCLLLRRLNKKVEAITELLFLTLLCSDASRQLMMKQTMMTMTKMMAVMVTRVIEDTDAGAAGHGDGGGGHDDRAIMATIGGDHVKLMTMTMAMTKTTTIVLWAMMVILILISCDA